MYVCDWIEHVPHVMVNVKLRTEELDTPLKDKEYAGGNVLLCQKHTEPHFHDYKPCGGPRLIINFPKCEKYCGEGPMPENQNKSPVT